MGAVWALSLMCCALGFGCRGGSGSSGTRLLDITGVDPTVLERGDSLRVNGAGFPAGRQGELWLHGVVQRPAAAPLSIELSLVAHAQSADLVVAQLDDAAREQLGGRGSFDGSLELRFAAARHDADVVGRLAHAEIDFLVGEEFSAREEQALRERATDVLMRAGIAMQDSDTLHGVAIASVEPDSRAEHAGLLAGDMIVSAMGVRVHALSDLAAAPDVADLVLSVSRKPRNAPLTLSLPLTNVQVVSLGTDAARMCMLAVFVLLVLLFASPLPSPTPRLLELVSRMRAPATSATAPLSLRKRMRAVSVSGSVFGLVLLCACVSSGTLSPTSLVAQQGAWPIAWKAFSHPELCVGSLLCLFYGARLTATFEDSKVLRVLLRTLLALPCICVLFGGYALPSSFENAWIPALWLGVAFCMAKVLSLAWLFARVAPLARESHRAATCIACAFVAVGTLAWLRVEAPRSIELIVGSVLFPTLLASTSLAWLQARFAKAPRVRSAAHASPLA